MKLAVTDACIFIDLYDLQLTAQFFNLNIEVHTSIDVIKELYENQQQMLSAFQSVKKLIVHIIKEEDKKIIYSNANPQSLSESDKTVLYLADNLNAMVLSSDRVLRKTAKNKGIAYHGMLWIFDELVKYNLISNSEASLKLQHLINSNLVFQNNRELVEEMEKRLLLWGK
jgi:predicted nucleic acid-binding protein